MLFNEPKLLKLQIFGLPTPTFKSFSALQRAEIAEISNALPSTRDQIGFSALQRAEIAEIQVAKTVAFLYF